MKVVEVQSPPAPRWQQVGEGRLQEKPFRAPAKLGKRQVEFLPEGDDENGPVVEGDGPFPVGGPFDDDLIPRMDADFPGEEPIVGGGQVAGGQGPVRCEDELGGDGHLVRPEDEFTLDHRGLGQGQLTSLVPGFGCGDLLSVPDDDHIPGEKKQVLIPKVNRLIRVDLAVGVAEDHLPPSGDRSPGRIIFDAFGKG